MVNAAPPFVELLYNRRATVTLGTLLFDSLRGSPRQLKAIAQGLRIRFKVKQTLDSKCNTAAASIFGLAKEGPVDAAGREAVLAIVDRLPKLYPVFTIAAGHSDILGTLFRGVAIKAENKRLNPGWETVVSASDGKAEGQAIVNKAFAPGSILADVIAEVARVMEVDASRTIAEARGGMFDDKARIIEKGLTVSGPAVQVMDALAKAANVEWSIVNGALVVQQRGRASAETAVLLTAETGLVGGPVLTIDAKRPGKKIL